jgi:formamidopyrimidine-DNA glycosylase
VLIVLEALLMGGGNALGAEDLHAARIDPAKTATAIAQAFSLALQDF